MKGRIAHAERIVFGRAETLRLITPGNRSSVPDGTTKQDGLVDDVSRFGSEYIKNAEALSKGASKLPPSPMVRPGAPPSKGVSLKGIKKQFNAQQARHGGGFTGGARAVNEMVNPALIGVRAMQRGVGAAKQGDRDRAGEEFARGLFTLVPLARSVKLSPGGPLAAARSGQAAAATGVGVSVSVTPFAGVIAGVVAMAAAEGEQGPQEQSGEKKATPKSWTQTGRLKAEKLPREGRIRVTLTFHNEAELHIKVRCR